MPRPKDYAAKIDRKTRTLFVVACEGRRSEEIYLRFMTANRRRVEIVPLSTGEDGRSAPRHLLERLLEWKKRNPLEETEKVELWMILDADHHFGGRHSIETHAVLSESARHGIFVALSNPRFELWLLLHFEDVTSCPDDFCEQKLRFYLGSYSHSSYNPTNLKTGLGEAIRRAQLLDSNPDNRLPNEPGTRLYQLMLAILEA